MNSIAWLMLALGIGIGACIGYALALLVRGGTREPEVDQYSDYGAEDPTARRWHRSDEDDHPGDIERQGSIDLARPGAAPYVGRDPAHRYDGMTDADEAQQATWQDRQLM